MKLTHFALATMAAQASAELSAKKLEHIGMIEQVADLFNRCMELEECKLVVTNALKKIEDEHFKENVNAQVLINLLEGFNLNDQSARALLKADMGLLDEYACWCYFEGDVGMGAGNPVDAIDEFCRTLQKGYECIIMDHADGGDNGVDDGCIPWEHEINSAFGSGINPWGLNIDNIVGECEAQNPGEFSCARKVCIVEGYFVMQYFNYAIFGGTIDTTLQHEQGFNKDSTCLRVNNVINTTETPIGGGGGGGGAAPTATPNFEDCCGSYPFRAPYWHRDDHQCCQNLNLFDATQVFCCSDGSIETSSLNCP